MESKEREDFFHEAEKLKAEGLFDDAAHLYYKCLENITLCEVFPSLPLCLKQLAFYYFEKNNYSSALQFLEILIDYYKYALHDASSIHGKIHSLLKSLNASESSAHNGGEHPSTNEQKSDDQKCQPLDLQCLTSMFSSLHPFQEESFKTDSVIWSRNDSLLQSQVVDNVMTNVSNLSRTDAPSNYKSDPSVIGGDIPSQVEVLYPLHHNSIVDDSDFMDNVSFIDSVEWQIENQGDNPARSVNSETVTGVCILTSLVYVLAYVIISMLCITLVLHCFPLALKVFVDRADYARLILDVLQSGKSKITNNSIAK